MRVLRHIPALILLIIGAIFLNYFLPSRDIVRIVGTEVKRIDVDKGAPFWDRADIGTNDEATRDVRFINAEYPNGKTRVYRNEDTGWGFPFYFKFDSGDVTAQAQSLSNQPDQWVAVRHYGWRIKLFSIFPNATSIKKVSAPNARLIPFFNIAFIAVLLLIWFLIWRAVRRWKAKRIDPTLDAVGDSIGDAARDVSDNINEGSEKARGFWRKLFGSPAKK